MSVDSVKKSDGPERQWTTGAQRDNATGKGRFDLLPPYAMWALARWFERGAARYDARNWEKGIPLSTYLDCAERHAKKHLAGFKDEPHDIAVVWNWVCLIETKYRIDMGLLPKELDDLPTTYLGLPTFEEYERMQVQQYETILKQREREETSVALNDLIVGEGQHHPPAPPKGPPLRERPNWP